MCDKCKPKQLGNGFEEQYIGDHDEPTHEQADEALQKQQNALIDKNTRITVIFGIIGIILGILQIIAQLHD